MTVDGLRVAALVGVAAVSLVTGWQIRDWQADSAALLQLERQAEQEHLARELVAGISAKTLEAIAQIRIEHRTIYQRATREVLTDVVYRDCRVPAAGVRLAEQARTGTH
jgi:uncharacterized membrane protein